jgi:hypothetical protein
MRPARSESAAAGALDAVAAIVPVDAMSESSNGRDSTAVREMPQRQAVRRERIGHKKA